MGGFGSGGRNKKSDSRAELDGNYRKKQPGQKQGNSGEIPTCPSWLSAAAKTEWRRVVPELVKMNLLSKLDRVALTSYCIAYAHVQECELTLQGGLVDDDGRQKPEVKIQQSYMKLIHNFCSSFGLSPSSRGIMQVPEKPTDEDAEFEAFLKREQKDE